MSRRKKRNFKKVIDAYLLEEMDLKYQGKMVRVVPKDTCIKVDVEQGVAYIDEYAILIDRDIYSLVN